MTRRWPVRPANRPTRRETGAPISRRRQPPPTHCGALHRNGRDLIIATRPAHQPLSSHCISGSGAGIISRPGASAFSVSDGPISSNSGRNGGKNAGRNCVSALPQRATPARRRPRFPSRNRRFPDRCRSADCASTAFRCRCLLLRQKLFVLPCRRLRNNYILCPTGTPTFAAARRQRRDLIIANASSAPDPTLAPRQRQRRKRYKRSPEPTTSPAAPIPRDQHRQICTCPPRAKGSLDRRSKRLSFPHFFLRRKKCGRRRPPPRQGKIDSPPQRRKRIICLRWG